MSSLSSYKDGSLGFVQPRVHTDGSLGGNSIYDMTAVSGPPHFQGMQHVHGVGGCGSCGGGLGEYFSSGLGFINQLDTTPKKLGAAAAVAAALYFVGKKTKLIKNKRRRRSRRRRR
jgi:hypothetical protein